MGIIPVEILRFSQIFGAFPLDYRDDTETGLRLTFSSKLYYWSLISYTIVASTFTTAIVYVLRPPLQPERPSSTIPVFFDSLSLCLLAIAVVSSQTSKYDVFDEMCAILETADKRLNLKLKDSVTKPKVYFILIYTTVVLVLTYVVKSHHEPEYWLYFLFQITYYTQASLFLQFTFICWSLKQRFIMINGKIREEAMKQNQQQQQKSSGSEADPLHHIRTLIHCYSQLCDAVEKANSFYGFQLLLAFFSGFIHKTGSIYFLIKINSTKGLPDLVIQVVWVFTHIVSMLLLVLSATAVSEAAEETAPVVCGLICRSPRNSEFRKKLKLFLLQLSHYKRGFSVSGLFQVDNEVLTSLASSVTTYLVILVQVQQDSVPTVSATEFPLNFTFTSSWMNNNTTALYFT